MWSGVIPIGECKTEREIEGEGNRGKSPPKIKKLKGGRIKNCLARTDFGIPLFYLWGGFLPME